MSGDEEMRLAEGFEPQDYDAWRATVEKALKGADFDRALATDTYDGFRLQPLYLRGDAPETPLRPATGRGARPKPWDIRQAVTGPDAATAAAQVKEELAEGATSVLLRMDAALRHGATVGARPDMVGRDGAALHSVTALEAVLAAVPDATPLALDAGAAGLAAATALGDRGLATGSSLGLDPMAATATAGLDVGAHDEWIAFAVGAKQPVGVTTLTASAVPYFDAGASEAEELGALIATGVAYLQGLEAAGLSVDAAAARIGFKLALSQDQFMTIAKARAARALWAAVLKHSGAADAPMRLDGVTATRMFARHDPHVNVLRATIAGFAGAVAGLDSITVLPFDARMGGQDPLARRVARNLQIVLAEESNLHRVADPAGGAFFVERLTDELAQAGWAEFQAIEQAGGMAAAVTSGMLAERIGETVAARDAKLAKRREAITGVSEFANLDDPPAEAFDAAATLAAVKADIAADGALLPEPAAPGEGRFSPRPIAAPFEALRDGSDAYLAKTGARPAVFLANIGALAAFNVRATFAANAFAAGGVAVAGAADQGYETGADAAAAFKASGARIACICGSDGGYDANGAAFAEALKQAGAVQVWLAGRPGEAEVAYARAGVDAYMFMGCDVLAALKSAHAAIGV